MDPGSSFPVGLSGLKPTCWFDLLGLTRLIFTSFNFTTTPLLRAIIASQVVATLSRTLAYTFCPFSIQVPHDSVFRPGWVKDAQNRAGTGGIAISNFDDLETVQIPSAGGRVDFRPDTTIGVLSIARSTFNEQDPQD